MTASTITIALLLALFTASLIVAEGKYGKSSLKIVEYLDKPSISDFQTVLTLQGGKAEKVSGTKKSISSTKDGKTKLSRNSNEKKKLTKEEEQKIIQWQKGIMQFHGAVMSLGSMYLSRRIMKVDYKNPIVLKKVRMIFVAYLVFAQLLYFLLKFMIKVDNNKDLVVQAKNPVLNNPKISNNPMMKLIEGFSGNKKSDVPMTVKQYDLQQNKELFTSLISEIIGVTMLHLIFKMGAPLLMVPMWGVSNRLKSPLVLIRLFGMKAVGQFARPFKNQFEMMMEDMASGLSATVGIEKDDETSSPSSETQTEAEVTVTKETAGKVGKANNGESVVQTKKSVKADVDRKAVTVENDEEDDYDDDIEVEEDVEIQMEKEIAQQSKSAPKPSVSGLSDTEADDEEAMLEEEEVEIDVDTSIAQPKESPPSSPSSPSNKKSVKSKELAKKLEEKMNSLLDDLEKPILPSNTNEQDE